MRRTRLLAAAALIAALLLVAGPSSAATKYRFSGKGAGAAWYLGDDLNTVVFIGLFEGTSKDVFVDVYQSWCDEAADELIDREFFTYEPADDVTMSISGKLTSASVSGTLELIGYEARTRNCAEPDYENTVFTELPEITESIAAAWSAAGKALRSSSTFRYDAGDCKFHSRSASKYRSGTATGSLTGDLELGSLGTSEYAELFQTKDMSVEVGKGCFVGPRPVPGK